jgi:M6 family metalloprotease-like protein
MGAADEPIVARRLIRELPFSRGPAEYEPKVRFVKSNSGIERCARSRKIKRRLALCAFTGILLLSLTGGATAGELPSLPPIDPQKVQDQQDMTWDDYRPIPGINWADPSLKPGRDFRLAVVAVDFSDQPFVITLPKKSDPFGNPQIDPVPREKVPQFYAEFWNKPSAVNHGQTINGYWMEQSRGKFGITRVEYFGPYRMPKPLWAYGLNEHRQFNSTPDNSRANSRMEPDVDALWRADKGESIAGDYQRPNGAVLRIYAGYDETGVWQEFGEMKFQSRDHIPTEWGNPDASKPRWVPTRYVEWTSWLAGMQQWGLSSMRQGENSGTIAHELGHFAFRIGDLNNNPYVQPYRRVAVGPWDMMDRGSFNGPGGPHSRWQVPPIAGASMPAGLMLRNRLENEFITRSQLVMLNRDDLAKSGLAVATVTARSVDPLPNTVVGITVTLDGAAPQDRTPVDDPATNALSAGIPNFNFYSLEVVQRIGYDSFCPDNGVLLAKNKNQESRNGGPNGFNGFIWVIDAHPEDINQADYIQPGTGKPVMRTLADYRQLNDALFHAGLNSGSQFEHVDPHNRLHFYVIDLQKNAQSVLSYTLGVRSLDGAGPQKRGVALTAPNVQPVREPNTRFAFLLKNTGEAATPDARLHFQDATAFLNSDIYRLTVSVEGQGWSAQLQNALATAKFSETRVVPVFVTRTAGAVASARLILKATSESDPNRTATAICALSAP